MSVLPLERMRPVYVAGVGLHPYQYASATPYVQLGLTAVRAALLDAPMKWPAVQAAYVATTRLGMAAGRPMLQYLGTTGIPITQVENASASGSSAFRLACIEVASGVSDVVLSMGVDKPRPTIRAESLAGLPDPTHGAPPAVAFALLAQSYLSEHGGNPEDLAFVSVKNHANAAKNSNAQRSRPFSLDEVMGSTPIAGPLTALECCPVGEGAAAAIVVSDDAIDQLGLDRQRCVPVVASAQRSEEFHPHGRTDVDLTRDTTSEALTAAGIGPSALDVVEMHDAFAIEELQYVEAMGLCPPGEAAMRLRAGYFAIGGECAVSPSGGLLAMGHPIGPTGVGQIAEIVAQLRGEAGSRQQPDACWGLAHLVGVGAVCVVHVLRAPYSIS